MIYCMCVLGGKDVCDGSCGQNDPPPDACAYCKNAPQQVGLHCWECWNKEEQ